MSRVSLNVVRSPLRHEARVLQLLQGHRAIPALLGYTRRPHFEYMAIELLGPSLRQTVKRGRALPLETVARVGEQMLSALEHLASHQIVHRDLKPDNILLCCVDPARVVLVDFSIAHHLPAVVAKTASIESDRTSPLAFPTGTTQFCSLSAHVGGAAPAPQDDLESLAYVLLFLYLGDLPWHVENPWRAEPEVYTQAVMRAYAAKQALVTDSALRTISIPHEIARLFGSASCREDHGRYLSSVARLREQFRDLASSLGESDHDPLNWSPVLPPASLPLPLSDPDSGSQVLEQSIHPPPDAALRYASDDQEPVSEYCSDHCYYETYLYTYCIVYGRRLSLTFPPDDAEALDAQLPDIADVEYLRPVYECDEELDEGRNG